MIEESLRLYNLLDLGSEFRPSFCYQIKVDNRLDFFLELFSAPGQCLRASFSAIVIIAFRAACYS